jgi:hypothetical protein
LLNFLFWSLILLRPVQHFVTVLFSHCIVICNFTKALLPQNFVVSCFKCITTTSAKLASSHYTVCIVIIHISVKIFPLWQDSSSLGKKGKDASKAKAPAKQGQDNWRSSCQVLTAAAPDAAAAPVAAPTTNAVVPPAGSLGTDAPSGISPLSATAATTAVINAATSYTAAADHSAAAAAPSSKKGASKARAPAEGIAAASGIAVPLANAAAGASDASMPDFAAVTCSAATAVPPPNKGSSKAKKPAKGTAVTSGIATLSAIAAAAISVATTASTANANHSAPPTTDAATTATKPIRQSSRAAAQTAKAVLQ